MAIYNGTQKIDMSGVAKVYVGTQLVYQKGAAVLDTITISGYTTSLNRNATFSFGGTVTANYSDGSTADVTSESTFSGYNMSVAGTYTVTVSYTENNITATATYSLTVKPIWVTLFRGTKNFGAGASTSTNWDIGIHQTDVYKFRITCSFKVRSYSYGSGKRGQISQYNPDNTLYTGYPMNTYTLASASYTTNNLSPSTGSFVNLFGVYSKDKSGVILPSESCMAKIVLAFKNLSAGPVFGPSYTELPAEYNEASITITKVEQYI